MAIIVQTNPPTAGANAYVSLAYFKVYLDLRRRSYVGKSNEDLEAAIVEATAYQDVRFPYGGYRAKKGQSTQFPRLDAYDDRGDRAEGTPDAVERACCEYAWRALTSGPLMPDPERDPSGLAVKSYSEGVGPIRESVEFDQYSAGAMPSYPAADAILTSSGLVSTGGRTSGFFVADLGRS